MERRRLNLFNHKNFVTRPSGRKDQFKRWTDVRALIEKNGTIHKYDLMAELGFSRSLYEKESAWWKFEFSELVEYDRKTGLWSSKLIEEPVTATESSISVPTITISQNWESEL